MSADMTDCDAACPECGGFVRALDLDEPTCQSCGKAVDR